MSKLLIGLLIQLITFYIHFNVGFNLSPIPNYILKLPSNLNYLQAKTRSSDFGYQINLRKNSLLISAPRLPPILESQREFSEPGGLFKCNAKDEICEPYIMDMNGNNMPGVEYQFNVANKSNQMFGAAIDGESQESDSFVACAQNIVTLFREPDLIHLYNGVCYLVQDTFMNGTNARVLAPLLVRRKLNRLVEGKTKAYYMFGQMGVSVHMTENSEEIIIGAPGVLDWKGTVIRYKAPDFFDTPGMSRRDANNVAQIQRQSISRFDVEIANPLYWEQSDDSYFGYAVTSGYFTDSPTKLLYVASAPQGNLQTGEVVIFNFTVHPSNENDPTERSIKIHHRFIGEQMGEYFGHGLLADDFNGDNLDDLAISAPFYGIKATHDSGKVYIFLNQGDMSFAPPVALYSNAETNGQFGKTLGKLGDINHDGYSDIAVSAPYEENGRVYIFLGGRNGVLTKPSQILEAQANSFTIPHLFGLGISKGVDIDNNDFNDIAIGSPNLETVNVYRAYPVVKIIATIIPVTPEISVDVTRTSLKTCWRYEMAKLTKLPFDFEIKLTIKLDPQLQRASFVHNSDIEHQTTVLTKNVDQCTSSDILVTYKASEIFKPIQLEVHYELVKKFETFTSFCEECVALNPNEVAFSQNTLVFSTGCKEIRCVADLRIVSQVVDSKLPYIIGSSRYLTVEYTVTNAAETAFLTQIKIDIPRIVSFYKIPTNCRQEDFALYCDLGKGKPLFNNEQIKMMVLIDTTRLEGNELHIQANVTSSSDELNPNDNLLDDVIQLIEFSEIEILGQSSALEISVEEIGLKEYAITHRFEISNGGPSNIKEINFIASIPIIYIRDYPLHHETLLNVSSIKTKCEYDGQVIEPKWSEPFIGTESVYTAGSVNMVTVDGSQHGINYDSSKHGQEYDLNAGDHNGESESSMDSFGDGSMMSLHSESTGGFNTYNRYTREIRNHHNVSRRSIAKEFNTKFSNLPHNRMLYFNCTSSDHETHHCFHAKFEIKNFRANDKRINVAISFRINLQKVDLLYTELRDMFLMVTSARVEKLNDIAGNSMQIVNIEPYTLVTKYVEASMPIWGIILAVLVACMSLAIIIYVLYRCGFFKRAKKEEMENLARQSQQAQPLALQGGANEPDDD